MLITVHQAPPTHTLLPLPMSLLYTRHRHPHLITVHQAETGDVIEIPVKRMATVEIAVRPRARQRRARRFEGPVLQRHGAFIIILKSVRCGSAVFRAANGCERRLTAGAAGQAPALRPLLVAQGPREARLRRVPAARALSPSPSSAISSKPNNAVNFCQM